MSTIRKATKEDASRIAEILVFVKRMNYRVIFQNDQVSFGEIQVLPIAEEFLQDESKLDGYWVYEEGFVKGLVHIRGKQIIELYVEHFFQDQGIGGELIHFAIDRFEANQLLVLEKNKRAIAFYQRHGFIFTGEREMEEGTDEFLLRMRRVEGI